MTSDGCDGGGGGGEPQPPIVSEACRITTTACLHVAAGRMTGARGCPEHLSFDIFDGTHRRLVHYEMNRTAVRSGGNLGNFPHGFYSGTANFPGYTPGTATMRVTCEAGFFVMTSSHGARSAGGGGGITPMDPRLFPKPLNFPKPKT